jgi:hypothetical protein
MIPDGAFSGMPTGTRSHPSLKQGWVRLKGRDDDRGPGKLEGVGPKRPGGHTDRNRTDGGCGLHVPRGVAEDVDTPRRQLAPDQGGAAVDRSSREFCSIR